MSEYKNSVNDNLRTLYNQLEFHFKEVENDALQNDDLYNNFQKLENSLSKEDIAISNFDVPGFQQKFTEYVNSKEGKIVIENVVAAVQKETNKSGNRFATDYDYQKLIARILSDMEGQEIIEEEINSAQRNDRINKEVKDSIGDALKNIKPWQGLS